MRVFVAVATVGRPTIARATVGRLAMQTRQPDGILVVGAAPEDVEGIEVPGLDIEVALSAKGLCRQRNRALEHIGDRADVIVFFDDDFVAAPDYVEGVEDLFSREASVAGATGRIIADGINLPGYSFEEAVQILAADRRPESPRTWALEGLYGCNMALRRSLIGELRFDEALPLYGWLEDIDFTRRLSRRGPLIKSERLNGVHMGAKGGRTSGRRLGYSQIANPLYMMKKGTVPTGYALSHIRNNVLANTAKALFPEPYVDRRGRLMGNLIAVVDLIRGRLDPRKVEGM